MSLADELRRASQRMQSLKDQDQAKAKKKRKVTSRSTSSGSASSDWAKEDDIIACYLQKIEGSKFFRENYSKKRKVPLRTMIRKIETFGLMAKGKKAADATDQMHSIYSKYAKMDHREHQQVVIKILRGEYSEDLGDLKPQESPAAVAIQPEQPVVRRESSPVAETEETEETTPHSEEE